MIDNFVAMLVEHTKNMLNKFDSRYFTRYKRFPALAADTIFQILKLFDEQLEPLDYLYLESKFIQIYEELIQTTYPHFFGYLRQSLFAYNAQNYSELQWKIPSATYDMEIMNTKVLQSILFQSFENLDDSLSNCFFDRVQNMIECDKLIIENPNLVQLRIVALYNACTANKVFRNYLGTGKDTYEKDTMELCKKIALFLSDYVNNCRNSEIIKKPSLFSYILYNLDFDKAFLSNDPVVQLAINKIVKHLPSAFPNSTFKDLSWMCGNLYHVSKNLFSQVSELFFDKLIQQRYITKQQLPSAVTAIAYFLAEGEFDKLPFGFKIEFKKIRFEDVYKIICPEYLLISGISISDSENERVLEMDGSEIRSSIIKLIQMSPNIPDNLKNQLSIESSKPHTGAEISDLEFKIEIGGNDVWVCIPIKSAKEISTKRVSEKFLNQLLRPFLNFQYVAVIFITAKECSINLKNAIKKYQDKHSASLDTIEGTNLTKLFKIYGVL